MNRYVKLWSGVLINLDDPHIKQISETKIEWAYDSCASYIENTRSDFIKIESVLRISGEIIYE